MKLQNSYIFLKHPYKEEPKQKDDNGNNVIVLGKNVYSYIKKAFPSITKVDSFGDFYKKKFTCLIQIGKYFCGVEFVITEVADITYVEIPVEAKSKIQIIGCLEHIQETLLKSGIRENYVEIISYDSVSEFYCNKTFVKLNTLERNLRKLLFNIYILNFDKDYYQATMGIELQGKIKGLINSSNSKEHREVIKKAYGVNNKQAEAIDRLQQFFYSFELADIQNFLFKPSWTSVDEEAKKRFLSEHEDLSKLSDTELRDVISHLSPRSDWERFFSNKINMAEVKSVIENVRLYRNAVVHFKFFYKVDYKVCSKLINQLNTSVLEAVRITEEIDFAEKSTEVLRNVLSSFSEKITAILSPIAETTHKLIQSQIFQQFTDVSLKIQKNIIVKQLGTWSINNALAEKAQKFHEISNAIPPTMHMMKDIIPPSIKRTQPLLQTFKVNSQFLATINLLKSLDSHKPNLPPMQDITESDSSEVNKAEDDTSIEKNHLKKVDLDS